MVDAAGVRLMICKLHRSGASFRGAIAYCLGEPRDRDREAERPAAPSGARSRVAWTETVNLATDDARGGAADGGDGDLR